MLINSLLMLPGIYVSEDQDSRLWKILEGIDRRLGGIEDKLESVIRLEERVNNHEQVISRYGTRLDEGDQRIRRVELWQAEHNPDMIITTLRSNADSIDLLRGKINTLEDTGNINQGQKDIGKEVLKWVAGIMAAYIIYKATRGM